MIKQLFIVIFCFFLGQGIQAQTLKVAHVFGDHMVIQQGINAPVWGTAEPGISVKVELAGTVSTGKADKSGKWIVRVPVLDYGGPYTMKVIAADTVAFNDVMVGEVWLASGQSNMEWRMGSGVGPNTEKEIAAANYPDIRYFEVPRKTSCIPLVDIEKQSWNAVNPSTVKDLSAVAYFFARELHLDKKVAVGIINSSWGATSIEAWMSAEMLATHPDFTEKVNAIEKDPDKWKLFVETSIRNDRNRDSLARVAVNGIKLKVYSENYDDSSWQKASYPVDFANIGLGGYWGLAWFRKQFELPSGFKKSKLVFTTELLAKEATFYLNGKEIGRAANLNGAFSLPVPSAILHKGKNVLAMRLYVNWGSGRIGTQESITKISSLATKEVIPLDGEWRANSSVEPSLPQWQNYYNNITVQYNARIAPLIPYGIKGVIWYQGENNAGKAYQYRSLFPLLINDWRIRWGEGYLPFLYVQLANFKAPKETPADDEWAELREAQSMALRYPKTGMAVTIDIGETNDIHPKNKVGVGKRLYLAARKIAYNEDVVCSGPVFKSMTVEGSAIRLKFSSTGSGLATTRNEAIKGFAISGADQKFYWADAEIDGDDVVVHSIQVPAPLAIRYAWAANPTCNLYNKEGLPAVPFRTDNWKLITQP